MATTAETGYTGRARYYSSLDGFDVKNPRVPAHVFLPERHRAFDPAEPTGLIDLDLSGRLALEFPATTPLILARYARIRAGERLATRFAASGQIYYAIAGGGETAWGDEAIAWDEGDAFCLPGDAAAIHRAGSRDCVLWVVTNEPALAFERADPPAPSAAPIEAVHFPADEIRRQLDRILGMPSTPAMPGKAVNLGSRSLERQRTVMPSFTLALNSLPPGEAQRAHRHNAVAVTLVVQGARCYSMIDGARVDWHRHAAMITPPGELHSHHNEGDELALFLIVQDGGLYYHCRTMGFSYK
jgi:gentisate 1,2-dioxygenase